MGRKYNRDIHHRQSIRLQNYDYSSAGAYFVTICTWQRECVFGEINNEAMVLNEFGVIVEKEWMRTCDIRSNVGIDKYVIMPNHFHGILIINDDRARDVGARRCLALDNVNAHNKRATHRVAPTMIKSNSLGSIIGQFKSIVTKQINALLNTQGRPVWHRNYYEHVIRNDPHRFFSKSGHGDCEELFAIRQYIQGNPLNWDKDEDNPVNF